MKYILHEVVNVVLSIPRQLSLRGLLESAYLVGCKHLVHQARS